MGSWWGKTVGVPKLWLVHLEVHAVRGSLCLTLRLGYFTSSPLLLYLPSSRLIRVLSSHFRIRSLVTSHPPLYCVPSGYCSNCPFSVSWPLQLLQVRDSHLKTEPGASDEREHVMSVCSWVTSLGNALSWLHPFIFKVCVFIFLYRWLIFQSLKGSYS